MDLMVASGTWTETDAGISASSHARPVQRG